MWRPCPRAQLAQSHWNQFGWCVFARHRWANFETLHHKHVLVISWPIDCHRKFEQMQKTNPTLSLYKASWCPAGISKHCRNPLVLGRSCCSTPGRSKPPPTDVWVPMVRWLAICLHDPNSRCPPQFPHSLQNFAVLGFAYPPPVVSGSCRVFACVRYM